MREDVLREDGQPGLAPDVDRLARQELEGVAVEHEVLAGQAPDAVGAGAVRIEGVGGGKDEVAVIAPTLEHEVVAGRVAVARRGRGDRVAIEVEHVVDDRRGASLAGRDSVPGGVAVDRRMLVVVDVAVAHHDLCRVVDAAVGGLGVVDADARSRPSPRSPCWRS